MKKINFSAGPAILPQSVLATAAQAVIDYNQSGLSLLEISHRSEAFIEIFEGARSLVRQLLQLTDEYEVLFLSGGASTQFCMAPYNLLSGQATAAYIDTGEWAHKAIKEAQLFGKVDVVASSEPQGYRYIPKQWTIQENTTYLHITTNNTIYGTEYQHLPANISCPLVVDMSSDMFSRPIDMSNIGLLYAGAQKNIGPAGTTLVVIRRDLLGNAQRPIPTMLDYRTHIKHQMFNTPPVFPIYCCYLTLQWIAEQGLERIAADNRAKANLLYTEIDRNSLFEGYVDIADRSLMNVVFMLKNPAHQAEFLATCHAAGCVGLAGHRTLGGLRASLYNAMDIDGVEILVELMQNWERGKG